MYSIEVHIKDSLDRNIGACRIANRSVEDLVNSDKIYNELYVLNYKEFYDQQKQAGNTDRWCRKLWKAYHPDLEQIILYMIPFVFMYFWSFKIIRQ